MVDVMGTPARVLTLGLDEREEGQPVLFLHGGAGSPLEAWGEWLSAIARLAPVVAYDRPGLGRSPFDDETPTPDRVAAHAHELMSVLGVDPSNVRVRQVSAVPAERHRAGVRCKPFLWHPKTNRGINAVMMDTSENFLGPPDGAGLVERFTCEGRRLWYDSFGTRKRVYPATDNANPGRHQTVSR